MKPKLIGFIACMALLTGVGVAKADTIVEFSAAGTFSNGWTLTGTMNVDITAGCIVGVAGCPGGSGFGIPSAPQFTVFSSPASSFL